MKIEAFYRKNLRNDEHFQFHTEFRSLIIKEGPQNLKVQAQFDAYTPLYEKEDEGIKRITKSALTGKIKEADKARDDMYSGMAETNAAALKHYDPVVSEAARKLKILFDTYGDVSKKPLNEQTSAVYNILQELKGNYAPQARTVAIDGWVIELESRNNAFDALMKQRFGETAARTDVVVKTARAELDAAYDAIVERVNAFTVIEGDAQYERFVKTLNTVIAKYTATLNARLGRKHHKAAAEADADTPEAGTAEGDMEDGTV